MKRQDNWRASRSRGSFLEFNLKFQFYLVLCCRCFLPQATLSRMWSGMSRRAGASSLLGAPTWGSSLGGLDSPWNLSLQAFRFNNINKNYETIRPCGKCETLTKYVGKTAIDKSLSGLRRGILLPLCDRWSLRRNPLSIESRLILPLASCLLPQVVACSRLQDLHQDQDWPFTQHSLYRFSCSCSYSSPRPSRKKIESNIDVDIVLFIHHQSTVHHDFN